MERHQERIEVASKPIKPIKPVGRASRFTDARARSLTRETGYDLIKAVASFMVVLLHVSGAQFIKYDYGWAAANIYDSATRVSVPLFFMVSGALLVTRPPADARKTLGRVVKIGVPLFVWSYLYIIFYQQTGMLPYSFNPMWILSGPVVYHFWFFYSLIGIYLFLPVLQAFFHGASSQNHGLFLGVGFVFASVVPGLVDLGYTIPFGIDRSPFPLYVLYTFAGAYLCRLTPSLTQAAFCSMGYALCSIGTATLTVYASGTVGNASELFYTYHSPLVVIGAVFLFVALRTLGDNVSSEVTKGLVNTVGAHAFGIFIFHVLFIFLLFPLGLTPDLFHPALGILITTVTIWVFSLLLTVIIRALPQGRVFIP